MGKWENKYLKLESIKSEWFTKLNPNSQKKACDFMNFAFYSYNIAKDSINNCQDYQRRKKMLEQFNDCVFRGWGFGVKDMDDALKHLSGGVWNDSNSTTYWYTTGKPKLYPGGSGFTTATACVNFIQAIENDLATLRTIASEFKSLNERLNNANKRANKNWEDIGEILSKIKDNAERAEPFLWSSPKIQSKVIKVNNYADLLSKLHSAATRVVKLKSLGLSTSESYGLAAGVTVLDFVPILGSLYSAAVDWIIDFIPQWKQFIRNYTRRLDLAAEGIDYTKIKFGNE